MLNLDRVYSLTSFLRNSKQFVARLLEERSAMALTVNGEVRAVLIDPDTYKEFEAMQERERFLSAIREGLAEIDAGKGIPAEEAFAELKAKHGF